MKGRSDVEFRVEEEECGERVDGGAGVPRALCNVCSFPIDMDQGHVMGTVQLPYFFVEQLREMERESPVYGFLADELEKSGGNLGYHERCGRWIEWMFGFEPSEEEVEELRRYSVAESRECGECGFLLVKYLDAAVCPSCGYEEEEV